MTGPGAGPAPGHTVDDGSGGELPAAPSPVPALGDRWAVITAAAAFAAAWLAPPVPYPLALGSAVAALVWRRRPGWAVATVVVLLVASLSGRAWAGLDPPRAGVVTNAEVVLTSDPQVTVAGTRAVGKLDGRRVQLVARGVPGGRLRGRLSGDHLVVTGTVQPRSVSSIARFPAQRIVADLAVTEIWEARSGSLPWRAANGVHRLLDRGASSLSSEERALLAGLVLGDDRAQPALLRDAFDAAGLTHLLAVSGQNVAFVLAAAGPILRRLGHRLRWLVILTLLGFFALVTRYEPSVLRAVAMAGLASTAVALGRPAPGVRTLALATTALLVIDPLLARSLGFQLSVAASAGILLLGPVLARLLPLPPALAVAASVPLAAQLFTAPLLVARFGSVPAVAILANVAVEPAAGAVMTWGTSVGVLAGFLPPGLAAVLHWPTRLLLRWITFVATTTGHAPLRGLGPAGLVLTVSVMSAGLLLRRPATVERPPRHPKIGALLVALGAVIGLVVPGGGGSVRWPPGVELAGAGDGAVLVVRRPADAAAVLRGLRLTGTRHLAAVVVASPADQTWRAAAPVLARYDPPLVLCPVPRPGALVPRRTEQLVAGADTVTVTPRGGRLEVEVAVADPPGPAP